MRTSVPKANDKDKRFFRTGPPNQKGYRFRAELPTISKDKDASSPHIKGKGVLPSTRDNGDHPHNKKRSCLKISKISCQSGNNKHAIATLPDAGWENVVPGKEHPHLPGWETESHES